MAVVHKFELNYDKPVAYELHSHFEVLHAGVQNEKPYMWVKTEQIIGPRRVHEFYILGTGQEFSRLDTALKTFFDGEYVWHVVQAKKARVAPEVTDPLEALKKK